MSNKNLKKSLNELIEKMDEKELSFMLKAARAPLIDKTLEDYLMNGSNGKRVESPKIVHSSLYATILKKSNVDYELFADYMNKMKSGDFDEVMNKILFGNGLTYFRDIKRLHPFISTMFNDFYAITGGVGTAVAQAGKGELLFIMLGGDKAPVGDVLYKGKTAEIKGVGAKIYYSRQNGVPGWDVSNKIFEKAGKDLGINLSDIRESTAIDFFNENAKTLDNMKLFVEAHKKILKEKYPRSPVISRAIDDTIKKMNDKFVFRKVFSSTDYLDIMLNLGFKAYLDYKQKSATKPVDSIVHIAEKSGEIISITNPDTCRYANSKYFELEYGFPKSRSSVGASVKNFIVRFRDDGAAEIRQSTQLGVFFNPKEQQLLLRQYGKKNFEFEKSTNTVWALSIGLIKSTSGLRGDVAKHANLLKAYQYLERQGIDVEEDVWKKYQNIERQKAIIPLSEGLDIDLLKILIEVQMRKTNVKTTNDRTDVLNYVRDRASPFYRRNFKKEHLSKKILFRR